MKEARVHKCDQVYSLGDKSKARFLCDQSYVTASVTFGGGILSRSDGSLFTFADDEVTCRACLDKIGFPPESEPPPSSEEKDMPPPGTVQREVEELGKNPAVQNWLTRAVAHIDFVNQAVYLQTGILAQRLGLSDPNAGAMLARTITASAILASFVTAMRNCRVDLATAKGMIDQAWRDHETAERRDQESTQKTPAKTDNPMDAFTVEQ